MRDVLLVTGGRGIGAAIIRAATSRDYAVCFSCLRDDEAAGRLVADLKGSGRRVHGIYGSIADPTSACTFFDKAERVFGPVTALVNNVGITGHIGAFQDAGGPGRMVNISPIAAILGAPNEYVHDVVARQPWRPSPSVLQWRSRHPASAPTRSLRAPSTRAFMAWGAGSVLRDRGRASGARRIVRGASMELPLAIGALDAPARTEPFASQLEGRARRPLGDLFGLKNFGVNLAALETVLGPGMCAGFKAGYVSHHFEGRSAGPIIYLGTGDRTKGDELSNPAEDLVGALRLQGWAFRQKDGTPH